MDHQAVACAGESVPALQTPGWQELGGWTRPTSGLRANGNICTALSQGFLLRTHRDKAAARRYFEKSIDQNGLFETVTIDGSSANLAASFREPYRPGHQPAGQPAVAVLLQ
jgi:hypothetical protein